MSWGCVLTSLNHLQFQAYVKNVWEKRNNPAVFKNFERVQNRKLPKMYLGIVTSVKITIYLSNWFIIWTVNYITISFLLLKFVYKLQKVWIWCSKHCCLFGTYKIEQPCRSVIVSHLKYKRPGKLRMQGNIIKFKFKFYYFALFTGEIQLNIT